jgi:hypothetical protein
VHRDPNPWNEPPLNPHQNGAYLDPQPTEKQQAPEHVPEKQRVPAGKGLPPASAQRAAVASEQFPSGKQQAPNNTGGSQEATCQQ